jgi:PAS domain S-box-containing protein
LSDIRQEVRQMALAPEVEVLLPTLTFLPMAAMITDFNGIVRWTNASLGDLTGYAVDEIAGQNAEMLLAGNRVDAIATGEAWKGESLGRRRNGETYDIHQTITPIRDATGKITHLLWTLAAAQDCRIADELRQCREQLDILNRNAPIPYQSLNADGCLLEVNEAWLQGLGYSRAEVIGRWFGDFLAPDQAGLFRERFPRFKERGWVRDVEFTLVGKDGSQIYSSFDGNIGKDSDGRFRQTHCVWRDITERKRAEDDLRKANEATAKAEANLSALIESTDDLIWSVDRNFGLLTFNTALRDHIDRDFGVRAAIGMGPDDLLTPAAAALWHPLYQRAFSEGAFRVEFPLTGDRTLELSFNPIRTNGQTVAVSVFGKDITERKTAEKALCEAGKQYRSIFDGAVEGIFRTAIDGRGLTANPALAKMLGYQSPEEGVAAVTDSALQVWLDPEERSRFVKLLEDRGSVDGYECRLKRKDGTAVWVSLNSRIVRGDDGRALYTEGFVRDITERKRAEERLRQANDAIAEAEANLSALIESTGDLIWSVGLDFRLLTFNGAFRNDVQSAFGIQAAIGMRPEDWLPPERAVLWPPMFHRVLSEGPFRTEYSLFAGQTVELSFNRVRRNGRTVGISVFAKDITERKRAEEALRQSEAKFAIAFQASPAITVLFAPGPDGNRILAVNDEFERATGYRREEAVGRTSLELGLWCAPGELDALMKQFHAGAGVRNLEAHFRKKSGDGIVGLLSAEWIELNGQQCGITITIDITRQREAEARLETERKRFQDVIEHTDAGYFRIGVDGRYEAVNPAWLRMHGFTSLDEAIGLHYSAVQVPEDITKANDTVEGLLRGSSAKTGEFARLRRDGTVGYHTFSANPVLDGGRVAGIEGFLVDTTERNTAEQARRQSEQRYRSLFDCMQEGVAIHELVRSNGSPENYVLLEVNRRYEEIVGVRREEVLNKTATAVYNTQAAPYLKEYASVVETGMPLQFETYFPPMDKHFIISVARMGNDRFATIFFDATVQKRTEERYKLISENAADVIWLWDLEKNRCVYVSPSVRQLRGLTPEEVLEQSMEQAMPPGTYKPVVALQQSRKAALESGDESARIVTEEVEYLRKDGTTVPTETVTKLLTDEHGKVRHVLGISRDIAERKRAEEALRQANEAVAKAEAHYRLMFNSVSDAVFVHKLGENGLPGRYLEVNDSACRYLGYTREELLRLGPFDLDPPEEHPDVAVRAQRLLADGHLMWEGTHIAKDGRRVPVEVNTHLVALDGSQTLISSVRDISDRKETERRYHDIFDGASEGIFRTLPEGKLVAVNSAFARMLGYESPAEIASATTDAARQLWLEPGARDRCTRSLEEQGSIQGFECQARRRDGSPIWVSINGRKVCGEDGRTLYYDGFVVDITERKKAEADKAKLEEQFRQAQKLESIGRLAGGVAHDFNNLLTVINGYSGFLLKGLKAGDRLRSYATEIQTAGERAASLTRQLLAFSRKQMVEPRVLDLNTAIRGAVPMLERLIGEDILLDIHLDDALGQVMADPDQIHQVIMNLVVNARDAMPDGGKIGILTANAEVDAGTCAAVHADATPGRFVSMTVLDSGHGIDEAIRQQIFDPFFTTKEVGKGTGLGLSTVYGIVRQAGGWIDVWSEVGVGTSFKVYLPRVDACVAPGKSGIDAPSELGVETILLVEDQEAVRTFTGTALKQHGYCVLDAADGNEAMAVAGGHPGPIHLLLTDVVIPGMNGRELSERLRELRPDLKVLFISGYAADVIAHRGVLDPDVAFLRKPFSSEGLAVKVREVLGVRRGPVD